MLTTDPVDRRYGVAALLIGLVPQLAAGVVLAVARRILAGLRAR